MVHHYNCPRSRYQRRQTEPTSASEQNTTSLVSGELSLPTFTCPEVVWSMCGLFYSRLAFSESQSQVRMVLCQLYPESRWFQRPGTRLQENKQCSSQQQDGSSSVALLVIIIECRNLISSFYHRQQPIYIPRRVYEPAGLHPVRPSPPLPCSLYRPLGPRCSPSLPRVSLCTENGGMLGCHIHQDRRGTP